MLVPALIIVGSLVFFYFVARGLIAVVKKSSSPTAPQRFTKRQRLLRVSRGLAVIGCFAVFSAYTHSPTPYAKLIPAAGHVTRIVTVSERQSGNSSSAPSSVNPFTTHDWVEITVEPTSPSSLTDDVKWRLDMPTDDDSLRPLHNADVTAKVVSLASYSKAYEVTTSTGQAIVRYDDTAVMEHRGAVLFACGAGFLFLIAIILYMQSRATPPEAA